jgi:hypothetical protein
MRFAQGSDTRGRASYADFIRARCTQIKSPSEVHQPAQAIAHFVAHAARASTPTRVLFDIIATQHFERKASHIVLINTLTIRKLMNSNVYARGIVRCKNYVT